MVRAITAKDARKFGESIGFPVTEDNGITFYAADYEAGELWEFNSKRDRDKFVTRQKAEPCCDGWRRTSGDPR